MGDVKFRNDFLGEIWVNLKKGAPVIFVAPQREFQSYFCILLAAAKSVVFSKPRGGSNFTKNPGGITLLVRRRTSYLKDMEYLQFKCERLKIKIQRRYCKMTSRELVQY